MDITKWLKTGAVIGAIVLTPAISMAARVQSCVAGPATPESYTWDFSREATGLLNDMRYDAQRVAHHATNLEDFAMNSDIDWQFHADQLTKIKREVDDMGKRLCRLEVIEGAVAPWQQAAINQMAPVVQLMADNTDDAINYMNAHQGEFWVRSYRMNVQNLDTEASTVARKVHRDEERGGLTPHEMSYSGSGS